MSDLTDEAATYPTESQDQALIVMRRREGLRAVLAAGHDHATLTSRSQRARYITAIAGFVCVVLAIFALAGVSSAGLTVLSCVALIVMVVAFLFMLRATEELRKNKLLRTGLAKTDQALQRLQDPVAAEAGNLQADLDVLDVLADMRTSPSTRMMTVVAGLTIVAVSSIAISLLFESSPW